MRLSVERAARQHEQAVVAEKDAFITELKDLIAKLEGQVGQYRHAKLAEIGKAGPSAIRIGAG